MCIFCERAKAQSSDNAFGFPEIDFQNDDDDRLSFSPQSKTSLLNKKTNISLLQKKEAETCEKLQLRRTPCTIITGFLGAGKTTFLNYILHTQQDLKLSVIENEFGEVSVDDALLSEGQLMKNSESQQVVLMPNGCMCCRVRGDLVEALKELILLKYSNGSQIDGIILEMSGLSEVAPVVQTFFADDFIQEHIKLDAVLGVCDSYAMLRTFGLRSDDLGEAKDNMQLISLVSEQLILSDRILLNKVDLVSEQDLPNLKSNIKKINPNAAIIPSIRGEVDLTQVLGIDVFSLNQALEIDAYFSELMLQEYKEGHSHKHSHGSNLRTHHHDSLGFQNVGVEIITGPLNWQAFQNWLADIVEQYEASLCRFKGVLWVAPLWKGGQDRQAVIQGLYGHYEKELRAFAENSEEKDKKSRLVFIGAFDSDFKQKVNTEIHTCLQSYIDQQKAVSQFRKNSTINGTKSSQTNDTVKSANQVPAQRAFERATGNQNFASRLGGLKFGDPMDGFDALP